MVIAYFILTCDFDSNVIEKNVTHINELAEEYGLNLDLIHDGKELRANSEDMTDEDDFSMTEYVLRMNNVFKMLENNHGKFSYGSLVFINTVYPDDIDMFNCLYLVYDLRDNGIINIDMNKRPIHHINLEYPQDENCDNEIFNIRLG